MADKDEWEFYYWCLMKEDGRNYMIGRGEFVRLMFEACGVGYKEMGAITRQDPAPSRLPLIWDALSSVLEP